MAHTWILKRNCSLTPRQSAAAYLLLCTGSFGIALFFLVQGFWIVLAFSILEMAAVGWALLYYARHALDVERIALTERSLVVERIDAGRHSQFRLDPGRTRVAPPLPLPRPVSSPRFLPSSPDRPPFSRFHLLVPYRYRSGARERMKDETRAERKEEMCYGSNLISLLSMTQGFLTGRMIASLPSRSIRSPCKSPRGRKCSYGR